MEIGLDIVVVVYNSSKWLDGLICSLEKSEYPLDKIHLTFVDNASSDDSVAKLENYKLNHKFGSFNIYPSNENLGFGKANNFGVEKTNQPYVFFLNVDTEVLPNTISELMNNAINSTDDVGLWECRQFPYEHPKFYNPVSLETSWSSAAACMVRREYFVKIGGFDDNIFMYAEDVDLSWRFRANGYKLKYLPSSVVYHYTYKSAGEVKPNQFYNSTFNNLMLRYKYGSVKDILKGYAMYNALYGIRGPAENHRKRLAKGFMKSIPTGMKFRSWKRKNKKLDFKPNFLGWDYELIREGAFYENSLPKEFPLVSIIVRTCGRPNVLRETLKSIQNQTYKNIEVVIVEDGPEISKKMIEEEFYFLNYIYEATGEKVGRCIVGNRALSLANGEYFNFLDDDDVFYADHVEVLVKTILDNPQNDAAYSIAFETPIKVYSTEPYVYDELFHNIQYRQSFNKLLLLTQNYFPIQTVLFSRKLYDTYGGFDLKLEYLEDWDLWIRYAMNSQFAYVEKVTSIYRVPAERTVSQSRQEKLDEYLNLVRRKHENTIMNISIRELREATEGIAQKTNIIYQLKNTSFKVILHKIAKKILR
ncbi:glycosyltransferase family 2 protein [Lysinibacillus sp. KU-BSD001]|uniref:glycosyltransferase family 2 protein n=1 Tax=Lysinibacillus sp. KU-BSD001 TaxID=3141328 RepID=UPI0036F42471